MEIIMRRILVVFFFAVLVCAVSWKQSFGKYYAFVPYDDGAGTAQVSVVQYPGYSVAAVHDVGSAPWGVGIMPNGKRLYVTNSGDNTISEVIIGSDEAPITVGGFSTPYGVAATLNSKYVFVANNGNDDVVFLKISDITDASIPEVVDDTDIPFSGPYGVAIESSGKYVFVTNNGNDTVTIIDVSDMNDAGPVILGSLNVGIEPSGIVISANAEYAYVANYGDDTASVFIVEDYVDYWEDYQAWEDGGSVGDPPDVPVVRAINLDIDTSGDARGPRGIMLSDKRNYLYVTNNTANTVCKIDLVAYEAYWDEYQTWEDGGSVGDPPAEPIEESVELDGTVGSDPSPFVDPFGISLTFSGTHIYVVNNGADYVSVINASKEEVVATIPTGPNQVSLGIFLARIIRAPSKLDVDVISSYEVELEWKDNSIYGAKPSFSIERSFRGVFAEIATVDPGDTSYVHTDLRPDSNYYYRVSAFDETGYSEPSDIKAASTPEDDACFISTVSGTLPILVQVLITTVIGMVCVLGFRRKRG